MTEINLKDHIRAVPDFPKKGILFYDIGTLLAHPPAWQETVSRLSAEIKNYAPDYLLAIDARGFLIGAAVADRLGIGLLMARKKGKLPGKTANLEYQLEYGTDTIEVSTDLLPPSSRLIVIDDLLATGGTASAVIKLAANMGAEIAAAAFIIELDFLKGRNKLSVPVLSLLHYDE